MSRVKPMADDRRQQILKAALDVFMRYGYRRTTMDDIAREVGKSRPALYLSFPNKEALLIGVVAMGHDELFRAIEAGLPGQGSLSAKLRHVFELWSVRTFEQIARSPAASELMNGDYAFAKDVFERGAKRLEAILSGVIRAAVATPGALQPSAEVRARIMIAAAHGFKTVARDTQEMRTFLHDLVRMTVAGLPVDGEATQAPLRPRRRKTAGRKAGTR
jgi:AcrR family transcriptional regulator